MNSENQFGGLKAQIEMLCTVRPVGRVVRVKAGIIEIDGLGSAARIGDWIMVQRDGQPPLASEVVQLQGGKIIALPEGTPDGVALQNRAGKFEQRHIRSTPGTIYCKKTEHRHWQIVQMRVGMRHRLCRFLCSGVK